MNSRLKNPGPLEPHPAARPPKDKPNRNQVGGYHPNLTALQALPANMLHRNKACIGIQRRGCFIQKKSWGVPLVAQQVKDPVLLLQQLGLRRFNLWSRNFHMPLVWPKKKKSCCIF